MSQENVQQDTPKVYSSLEEAVFSDNDTVTEGSQNIEGAFTNNPVESQEKQETPQGQPVENTQSGNQVNDEARYQYWQSQADKLKNENDRLKSAVVQQQTVQEQQVPANVPAEPAIDDFPTAPEKPQKPRSFNREEAYADPQSESARYLDEVEDWRDNMNQYSSLKSQYQTAIVEEKLNTIQQQKVDEAKRYEARNQQAVQESKIREHVMVNYGMNATEARDFMTKMSNPKSINIDNLVQLYRMQGAGTANQQTTSPQPSDSFQQIQNAQQVPSPMGVMPSGQSANDGRSMEDKMIDTMIGNFNSKNPWK